VLPGRPRELHHPRPSPHTHTLLPFPNFFYAAVEGYILVVTNVHEEAGEDQILDAFSDYGTVKNVALNLDKRTGYAKGYALVEFGTRGEAERAREGMDGKAVLGKEVRVDFAFVKEGGSGGGGEGGGRRGGGGGGGRR
jgi:RNA-binding protein 8A